ncbi:MAG: hypothetical protein DSY37_02890 [Hyperthermus sp.]|nr:MAG: hypothetical protein DSY37_02890 [Hyperthermus sp.]
MSAVHSAGYTLPSHSPAVDIVPEKDTFIDVEIDVYGGFDPLTDELIENARKAMEILRREYGVEALLVPRIIYWAQGYVFSPTPYSIPVLVINGKEVSSGRILSPQEIVEVALKLLGIREEPSQPLAPYRDSDRGEVAAAAW